MSDIDWAATGWPYCEICSKAFGRPYHHPHVQEPVTNTGSHG
jgi:hypothetical protein